jgi:hypothetical protein
VLDDADALRTEVAAGASPSAIAARLSVDVAEVHAALEAHGLALSTSPPRAYPQLYEAGWLAKRLRARRSLQQIADEVGCSTGAVRTAVRSLGIADRRGRRASLRAAPRPQMAAPPLPQRSKVVDGDRRRNRLWQRLGGACAAPSWDRGALGPEARRYPQLHDIAWL